MQNKSRGDNQRFFYVSPRVRVRYLLVNLLTFLA